MTVQRDSSLATRRGGLSLLLPCAVQFLDVADSSIMNVALPSLRRDLGFSVQNLRQPARTRTWQETRPQPATPDPAAPGPRAATNRST